MSGAEASGRSLERRSLRESLAAREARALLALEECVGDGEDDRLQLSPVNEPMVSLSATVPPAPTTQALTTSDAGTAPGVGARDVGPPTIFSPSGRGAEAPRAPTVSARAAALGPVGRAARGKHRASVGLVASWLGSRNQSDRRRCRLGSRAPARDGVRDRRGRRRRVWHGGLPSAPCCRPAIVDDTTTQRRCVSDRLSNALGKGLGRETRCARRERGSRGGALRSKHTDLQPVLG